MCLFLSVSIFLSVVNVFTKLKLVLGSINIVVRVTVLVRLYDMLHI